MARWCSTPYAGFQTNRGLLRSLLALLFLAGVVSSGSAQQSSDPSRFDFFSVRLYMTSGEALQHIEQMRRTLGGEVHTDDQASVFLLNRHYTRSIVWETEQFTLIADLLQYRRKGKIHEAVVGLSVHPKTRNRLEADHWFQNTSSQYGVPTFSSLVGPDSVNSLYFCQTKDARSCEAEMPILIVGHNYVLLSDCGYVDRMSDPVV